MPYPPPRSVRFAPDEIAAIQREAERLGYTENGYIRAAVRALAGLPLPSELQRQLVRDAIRRAA